MSHVRVHSTRAVALGSILPTLRQQLGPKPKGLWWAVGDAWIDWCIGEGFRVDSLRNTFRLDVDDSKLLVIGRDMTLDKFDREFAAEMDFEKRAGTRLRYSIDWPKVAERWSGIEIPVYSWAHRHELMWYYGWDVASGCLWKQDALRGVKKIARRSIKL